MKKAVSLLLAVVMLLGMLSVTALAADDKSELTVTGGGDPLTPGDVLTATMTMPASTIKVCNYGVAILFNTDVLEATDVQFAGPSGSVVTNASEGNAAGGIVANDAWADERMLEALTLTVTFKVREDAASGTYDKLVWIDEDKTLWGDPEGVESVPAYGNKTYGATVESDAAPMPFTATVGGQKMKVLRSEKGFAFQGWGGGTYDLYTIVVPDGTASAHIQFANDEKYVVQCWIGENCVIPDRTNTEVNEKDINRLYTGSGYGATAFNYTDEPCWWQVQTAGYAMKYFINILTETDLKALGYRVELKKDAKIAAEEQVQLTLNVSDAYNAFYYELSYDPAVLEFVSTSAGEAKAADGKLTVAGYGEDRSAPVTLTFKGIATGASTVTLTKANIDEKNNADTQDAPAAIIAKPSAKITVGAYQVNLPEEFIGESVAYPGQDYSFEAKDKNYNYTVTATVGGKEVDVKAIVDEDEIETGAYTIPAASINGNIVITCTKEGKPVYVRVNGGGKDGVTTPGNGKYMEDYTFSVADDAYNYTITVKIGGADYPIAPNADGLSYTIPGKDMRPTALVVITAERELKPESKTTVSFTGSGAADVVGGVTQEGNAGKDFTFTIDRNGLAELPTAFESMSGVKVTKGAPDGTVTMPSLPENSTVNAEDITNLGAEIPHYIVYLDRLQNVKMLDAPNGYESGKIFYFLSGNLRVKDINTAYIGSKITQYLVGVDAEGKYTILAAFDFKSASQMPASDAVYTVTLDGETLIPGADGSYTVPAAKMVAGSTVTVNVEKTVPLYTVEVSEYLKLDGKSVWLVTAAPKAALAEGKTLAYDGNAMFTSEKYGGYAYLVISADTLENVKTAATAALSEITAISETVAYDFDVNGTKAVDVNDAQLVYNLYNTMYDDFGTVSIRKFLEADVNGDKTVSTLDSAAIVNHILGSTTP